jgi:FixJ family two-component response regulator
MPPASAIHVYIIDDDASVADALARVARSAKLEPQTFGSVEEFLSTALPTEGACVVCDIQLPGASGLDLPRLLKSQGKQLPVIIVTADSHRSAEHAHQAGAVAFFHKPMDDHALLDAILWAVGGATKG